jgi:hypothetical protein
LPAYGVAPWPGCPAVARLDANALLDAAGNVGGVHRCRFLVGAERRDTGPDSAVEQANGAALHDAAIQKTAAPILAIARVGRKFVRGC